MGIKLQSNHLQLYLQSSEVIDFDNPTDSCIRDLADVIEKESKDATDYIKNAYEYVRDKIAHSADINHDAITYKATDVLRDGHGICFAKSHLLAALLRCKGIPAGFCYQKLILDDETAPVLIYHGLNGVYIEAYSKWIRLDARGNKKGVSAVFSIEQEQLAFAVRHEKGEIDLPIIYYEPDKNVMEALTKNQTRTQLWTNLPSKLAIE